jgi:hypothetical protein
MCQRDKGGGMICDRCGVDLPESVFWDDECIMCHSERKNEIITEKLDELIESYQKSYDAMKFIDHRSALMLKDYLKDLRTLRKVVE